MIPQQGVNESALDATMWMQRDVFDHMNKLTGKRSQDLSLSLIFFLTFFTNLPACLDGLSTPLPANDESPPGQSCMNAAHSDPPSFAGMKPSYC